MKLRYHREIIKDFLLLAFLCLISGNYQWKWGTEEKLVDGAEAQKSCKNTRNQKEARLSQVQ